MTYQSLPRARLLALGLVLATTACGKDERISGGVAGAGAGGGDTGEAGAAGAGPDEPSSCPPVAVGRGRFFFNAFGELTGLRYPLLENLGDPELDDYMLIELYDSTSESEDGFLPPLETGTFDLSLTPDNALATCQHCVSLVTDVTEGTDAGGFPVFQPARWFYARSGEMRLDEVHDPLNDGPENSAMFGSISSVELAEIDLNDPTLPFAFSDECFLIEEVSFDTRPKPGAACEDLDDCGNELLEVCDPETLACTDEVQCGLDFPCEDGGFCIQQSPLSPLGACYSRCTPFASGSCPDAKACVQYRISELDGYCLTRGEAPLGAACEAKDADRLHR